MGRPALFLALACVVAATAASGSRAAGLVTHGTLLFVETDPRPAPQGRPPVLRVLSGNADRRMEVPYASEARSIGVSPRGDRICYDRAVGGWPPSRSDILTADLAGARATNLTEGLGGINCYPKWSPDGSMIAFTHAESRIPLMPCQAGFHAWVMRADGSQAHAILPESQGPTFFASWSPDGSRVLLGRGFSNMKEDRAKRAGDQQQPVSVDLQGRNMRTLPHVGGEAAWSPDGTSIVSADRRRGTVAGRAGWWNHLVLTDSRGRRPRVLVKQFIADADLRVAVGRGAAREITQVLPEFDMEASTLGDVGPTKLVWSPGSNQIAFLAAMPFDPKGERSQIEVFIYDLSSKKLLRVTRDKLRPSSLAWIEADMLRRIAPSKERRRR